MYTTQDIDEASYLISEGFSLRRTPPPDSRDDLVTFHFQDSDEIRDAASAWQNRYADPVQGDLGLFSEARKDLFRRVREVRG